MRKAADKENFGPHGSAVQLRLAAVPTRFCANELLALYCTRERRLAHFLCKIPRGRKRKCDICMIQEQGLISPPQLFCISAPRDFFFSFGCSSANENVEMTRLHGVMDFAVERAHDVGRETCLKKKELSNPTFRVTLPGTHTPTGLEIPLYIRPKYQVSSLSDRALNHIFPYSSCLINMAKKRRNA
jgi:hypothetical protein